MASASERRGPGRGPLIVFGGVEAVAFVVWLIIGRAQWFYIDEWDFFASRKAGDLGDLFRPHNGHWTTLPVLVFRFLYSTFALRSTVPYRVVIIVLYLVAAALLLAVMRRAGVHPWIATSAGVFFVLFGAGWENIILPFQITFVGSLTFGLAHLLLADHDGPFDCRDALGLAAGLLGLMCSGVGVVMVGVVGAAVFVRRGRELALLHVVPLAGCYVAWFAVIGHTNTPGGQFGLVGDARFMLVGLRGAYGAIGPFAAFGFAIVVLLIVGLALAAMQRRCSQNLATLGPPAALLVGAFVLLGFAAVNGEGFGAEWARQSRYVSLTTAMTLPALAVAADAVAKRWRRCLPFAIAVFLVGVPTNLNAAVRAQRDLVKPRDIATRQTMLSLPRDPLARRVPRSVRPEPTTAADVTIGWLLDAAARHQLPNLGVLTPELLASDNFRLSFYQRTESAPTTNCRSSKATLTLDLRKGDNIGIYGDEVRLAPATSILVGLDPQFLPSPTAPVQVLRDVGLVRVTALPPRGVRVCVGSG